MKSKIIKRLAAIVLALSMALSLSACGDTTWVLDYNGKKVTSGVYLSFVLNSYAEAGSKVEKPEENIFKQKIEEKDAKVWMEENALKLANQYMMVENKFEEMKLSFSETDINEINQSVKVRWPQYQAVYEKNGIGEKSFRLLSENQKKAEMIFDQYYNPEGGIEPIKDDALMVHYKENFANIIKIPMYKAQKLADSSDTDIDGENKKILDRAEAYAKDFNDGKKKLGEIYDEETHFTENTTHDSENKDDVIYDDKEMHEIFEKKATSPSADVVKSIFAMKDDGKATVFSDENGYYIVARYPLNDSKEDFAAMRSGLLSDLKGTDFKAITDKWTAETKPTTTNSAAVKRYSPKKIDMTQPTTAQ